jgi:hypothetical protein
VFPRDIVCFRNICINTLHKGDNHGDDDDNNNNNNSNNRIAATMYSLVTLFVSGIYV